MQARESAWGRPPLGLCLGDLDNSLMNARCSSLSCGRRDFESSSILDAESPRDRSPMLDSSARNLAEQPNPRFG